MAMHLYPDTWLQDRKYKIIRTLGQGGFGITYEAEQVNLGRTVAIKEFFMKDCCERDAKTGFVSVGIGAQRELVEKFRRKFIREARMLASLRHRYIVRVIDVFVENNTAYYVMENLPGGSLAAKVRDSGPLSESVAEKYIRQVAEALAYVHSRNTVHLDVKPANILLNEDGDAVLIDFGVSKHYDEAGEQTSSTPVGVSKGYAPHEQSLVGDVSQFKPSTDIYSLGATLFYLLTGTVPPDASLVLDDGLERPKGISDRMWTVIQSSMQPKRKDRPQSISAFMALLDNVLESEETVPEPMLAPHPGPILEPRPKPGSSLRLKPWLWALLAGIVLASIVTMFLLFGKKGSVRIDESPSPANPVSDATASIIVSSNPSGATIWLDGKNTNKTTPEILEDLTPGSHRIRLALDRYEDYAGVVKIVSGVRSQLSRTLTEKTVLALDPQQPEPQKQSIPVSTTGVINGHEWVDLGLSVKWATCNVGASSPSDYGVYYAWGETSTKSDYDWLSLKYCTDKDGHLFSKYVPSDESGYWSGSGSPDNKTRLDMSDDAANVNWKGTWRIPTDAEWTELRVNCTWVWTTINGKDGYRVTGKNGNSIFLPAAGYWYYASLLDVGSIGCYWASSLDLGYPNNACSVYLYSSKVCRYYLDRNYGSTVRPVTE